MNFISYIKNKSILLCVNLVIFIFFSFLFYIYKVDVAFIILIFTIWLLPIVSYVVSDYYKLNSKKSVYKTIETSMMTGNFLIFILPDEKVEGLTPVKSILNLNYKNDKKANEVLLEKDLMRVTNENDSVERLAAFEGDTKKMVNEANSGLSTIIVYMGIYLGIIFLITSGAVLAIQQLSEAEDNKCRYEALKKIGVDRKMRNKSIFIQILIYFMMPLSLAIVHSIVGLYVANEVVVMFGRESSLNSSLITGGAICVIYGAYFLATYNGCKNTIK